MEHNWHEILETAKQYRVDRLNYWIHDVLFSPQWWLLLIITIGLMIIWVILLDKSRVLEIVIYGLLVSTIANLGDTFGLSFSLWGYRYNLVHLPEILEVHNIMMPIIYMVIYQYCHTWKSFMIANAANALLFSLILEPILAWLDIYEVFHWKFIYSVIPYFLIAVGLKWLIDKFKQMDHHYR